MHQHDGIDFSGDTSLYTPQLSRKLTLVYNGINFLNLIKIINAAIKSNKKYIKYNGYLFHG